MTEVVLQIPFEESWRVVKAGKHLRNELQSGANLVCFLANKTVTSSLTTASGK